jgi:hypothetical protein
MNEIKYIIDKIYDSCEDFLHLVKPFKGIFLHGSQKHEIIDSPFLYKKNVKKNAETNMVMTLKRAEKLNDYLVKHGHCKRDSSIFGTSEPTYASYFGKMFYLLPIGDFKYTFCKASDFNFYWTYDKDFRDSAHDIINGVVTHKLLKNFFVSNKDIDVAHERGYEIWFDCKECYLVNESAIKKEYFSELLYGK